MSYNQDRSEFLSYLLEDEEEKYAGALNEFADVIKTTGNAIKDKATQFGQGVSTAFKSGMQQAKVEPGEAFKTSLNQVKGGLSQVTTEFPKTVAGTAGVGAGLLVGNALGKRKNKGAANQSMNLNANASDSSYVNVLDKMGTSKDDFILMTALMNKHASGPNLGPIIGDVVGELGPVANRVYKQNANPNKSLFDNVRSMAMSDDGRPDRRDKRNSFGSFIKEHPIAATVAGLAAGAAIGHGGMKTLQHFKDKPMYQEIFNQTMKQRAGGAGLTEAVSEYSGRAAKALNDHVERYMPHGLEPKHHAELKKSYMQTLEDKMNAARKGFEQVRNNRSLGEAEVAEARDKFKGHFDTDVEREYAHPIIDDMFESHLRNVRRKKP